MTEMNSVDIGIMIVVGLSMLSGLSRGLLGSFMSIFGWIAVIVLSYNTKPHIVPVIQDKVGSAAVAGIAAYLVTAIFFTVFFSIFNAVVLGLLKPLRRSPIDKILGLFFGGIRGSFYVLLIFICVSKVFSVFNDGGDEKSLPGPFLNAASYPLLVEGRNLIFNTNLFSSSDQEEDAADSGYGQRSDYGQLLIMDIAKLSRYASPESNDLLKNLKKSKKKDEEKGKKGRKEKNGGSNKDEATILKSLIKDYKKKVNDHKVHRSEMLPEQYIKRVEKEVRRLSDER